MKTKNKCVRCNYEWEGMKEAKTCPKCKSYFWREPRKREVALPDNLKSFAQIGKSNKNNIDKCYVEGHSISDILDEDF